MTRAIASALFVLGCAAAVAGRPFLPEQSSAQRVLSIGNSLTSAHDVPRLVEHLTGRALHTASVVQNNFSLDDHWSRGEARKEIERGGWAFVVLQQGPSALPESRVQLRASVRQFDAVIRKAGARPALYMVWPSLARRGDFDRVNESYALAAADVDGVFIPAGEAWRAALRRDPGLALYGEDGFHPTPQASYLAAMVIAGALTGRDPSSLAGRPAGWPSNLLTDEQLRLFQASAQEVLRATARF